MKKLFLNMKQKIALLMAACVMSLSSVGAHAELPAWFGTAFTGAETDLLAAIAIIGPIMIGVAVAWLIPRLGKKGVNKLA